MVREYTLEQRRFLVKRKLAGATLAVIQQVCHEEEGSQVPKGHGWHFRGQACLVEVDVHWTMSQVTH